MIDENDGVLGLEQSAVRLRKSLPEWAELYELEAASIRTTLGDLLIDIQHFGSTSIPGLKAKPILDILAAIARIDDGPICIPLMHSLGYEYSPEAGIPGDYVFRKSKGELCTHLVHIVEHGSFNWTGNLKFRNALRGNPSLAAEYERLKVQLSAEFQDRKRYTDGKTDFVMRVVNAAD